MWGIGLAETRAKRRFSASCNQFVKVRYGNSFSDEWKLCNGVRQGGILSALFFNIYIDSLITRIANSNIGCKLGIIRSNVIAYADDVVLLAPTPTSLQLIIDIAFSDTNELDLTLNVVKYKSVIS